MKTYILAIAGVILLSAVVTMIAPSGKMGKFVKGTMKLVILVVMISPAISWVKSGKLDLPASTSVRLDEGYLEACSARLEAADEEEIGAYIAEQFSVDCTVKVTRSDDAPFSREKILITVDAAGIIGTDEHIHIVTCIREAIEARYGAHTEVS